jgi:hypothetical protein
MKLAGMVGRPLGDLERAGDFSPMKNRYKQTDFSHSTNLFINCYFFYPLGFAI